MTFVKRDVVLWLKHLEEAGIPVPSGCAALFRVGDTDILFEPMRPGPSGRPTPGLRATGATRAAWSSIPLSTVINLELVRVDTSAAALAGTVPTRLPSRLPTAAPHGVFEAVEMPPSRNPAFDAYLTIDWSAASSPRTGKDSIWWCLCTWRRGRLVADANENLPTRQACYDLLRARLRELVAEGKSVLVAFDFPYGYPAGLAKALDLKGTPWRAIWNELTTRIADDQVGGTNNRFQVASDLNQQIGAPEGPFWGHPQHRAYPQLRATEPAYPVGNLARLREADRQTRGVQPVWKLWGNGSVGSQTLLGVPILARLRDDDDLRDFSAIWPFETGSELPPRGQEPRIIFAEIYPSMVELPEQPDGRVKDSAQVEAIARHLARHDAANTLSDLFAAPATLEPALRHRVETEEGWILGVEPTRFVSKPSSAATYERARRLANIAVWSVELQCRRLRSAEPEDEVFVLRKLTDFTFLVVSLTRLRRAAQLAAGVPELQPVMTEAIDQFDRALPGLKAMRDVGEHIDDYVLDRGRTNISRQSLEVSTLEDRDPTLHWLGAKLNAPEALEASRQLFAAIQEASRAFQTSAYRGRDAT